MDVRERGGTPTAQSRVSKFAEKADRPSLRLGELAVVTLAIATLAVALQLKSHCYAADLSEDEASHYVSGLAIHDYLLSSLGSSPIAFIKSFHGHYPLIGIGHWGPLYYFVEAVWMLVFSTSLASVLALSATVTTATALGIYLLARRSAGRGPAFASACIFVMAPLVVSGTSDVMLDIPIALLCLGAMYAYALYVETGRARHSVIFGLAASAAMLIKGNAACLALLPPLAILFARRFDLLKKPSFWLPLPIAAVLVGPWYVLTYGQVAAGFRYQWSWQYVVTAVTSNSAILISSVGPVVLAAAVLGIHTAIARAWTHRPAPLQSVACGLLAAVWIFQSIVPAAIQDRYLAPLLPPLLILAADGIGRAAIWLKQRFENRVQGAEIGVSLLLLLSVIPFAATVPVKPTLGFMIAAPEVWHRLPPDNHAVLAVSNGAGEGAAIAALAMYDPRRPSLFVVRGSRLLGGGGYNNADYRPRFDTVEQVMAAIDDYAIPLVLFHPDFPHSSPWLHTTQVADAAHLAAPRWAEILRVPSIDSEIRLYRIHGNDDQRLDAKRLMALSAPKALSAP
jgi:hypothetical protein